MKTNIKYITLIILLSINISNYAQDKIIQCKDLFTQRNAYNFITTDNAFILSNKNNTLYNNNPIPAYMYWEPNKIPNITISDNYLLILDNLVQKYLKPYFTNNLSVFYIHLISDKNTGNLKEVRLKYSKDFNISIEKFEQFEESVLNNNIKLSFNPYVFSSSNWVGVSIYYEVDNIFNTNPPFNHWITNSFY